MEWRKLFEDQDAEPTDTVLCRTLAVKCNRIPQEVNRSRRADLERVCLWKSDMSKRSSATP